MTYGDFATQALDFVAFRNFTQYSFDPSAVTNPDSIVQTPQLPLLGTALPVDPNWYLLTLSVDAGGSIPPIRTVPLLTLSNPTPANTTGIAPWGEVFTLLLSTFQYMLTIIDFSTTPYAYPNATADAAGQQALAFQTRYYTWGYSINSSSVKFGAAVAVMGAVVVVAYVVLSSLDRREHRSITDIIASALENGTAGVFRDADDDGKEKGKKRFTMVECATPKGRFVFEPAEEPRPYQYVVKDNVDLERSRTPSPILRPEAPHMNVAPLRGSRYYTSS